MVALKRVYEPAVPADGFRILTDRLWPRGLSKEKAQLDVWLKDIAPTTQLRKWFNHDPEKWHDFARQYQAELRDNPAVDELRALLRRHKKATLLFGAKDEAHNQAVVIRDFLAKG